MVYENILTEMNGDVLVVTLHRPEKLNAMTHQMRVDLLDCVRCAEDDDAAEANARDVVCSAGYFPGWHTNGTIVVCLRRRRYFTF